MPRRDSSSNQERDSGRPIPRRSTGEGDLTRPIPRRGAGKGGGRDRTRRSGRGLGNLNPFDVGGRKRVGASLREQEEQPYRYDSNQRQLLIIKIVLAFWIILAIASVVAEYRERDAIARLQESGFNSLPNEYSVDSINAFIDEAVQVQPEFNAVTNERVGRYGVVFDQVAGFKGTQETKFILFAGFLFLFVVISVMVASFAYQANRNLLTLKTESQKFSSTSAMIWLFVPLFNFFRGAQIFGEIWRGSHPAESTSGGEAWKSRSSKWWVDVWWFTFAVVIFLNIIFRTQFASNEIDARMTLAWAVILSDLFMIVPAVLAYKTMIKIHEMQERRHEIVGPHLAVPPPGGLKL